VISLKNNDKFYSLIKAYLKSGYSFKIRMKSKKIGATRIKIVEKKQK